MKPSSPDAGERERRWRERERGGGGKKGKHIRIQRMIEKEE